MTVEREFQTRFTHYLKHVYKKTGAFELKATKTDSLPFSDLQAHQEQALLAAKHDTLVFKIPDAGYQNPFDQFSLAAVPAFVVIFYSKSGNFYMIDIDEFILSRETSKRRYLLESEAAKIASFSWYASMVE